MKKTILGIMLTIFVIGLFAGALNIQPTRTQPKTLMDADNCPIIQDGTNSANQDQPQENGNVDTLCNENSANPEISTENANSEKSWAADYSGSQVTPNPDCHTPLEPHPPDGRIYLTPPPPYAYIPTYTPKNWNIPINSTLTPLS